MSGGAADRESPSSLAFPALVRAKGPRAVIGGGETGTKAHRTSTEDLDGESRVADKKPPRESHGGAAASVQGSALLAELQRDPSFKISAGLLSGAGASVVTGGLRGSAGGTKLPGGRGGPGAAGSGLPHFDVDHFLRSSHRTVSVSDRLTAAEVLRVDPYDRSAGDVATLSKFLAAVDFFSGLSESLRNDVAAIATIRSLRKDEPVYEEGDAALHLYVVLSGSVGTRVRDFLRPNSLTFFVAATVAAGECFGQESMGTEEHTLARTQTKVALERTELLQVDMRDYKGILRVGVAREASDKIDFVATLPLFEMCTLRELHRIAACMQVVRLAKNTVILRQGEAADRVYFIASGEVRVIHKVYTRVRVLERPRVRLNSPTRHAREDDDEQKDEADERYEDDERDESKQSDGGARRSRIGTASTAAGSEARARRRTSGGKGGGAYQFERARAFTAHFDSVHGGGSRRPVWGHSVSTASRSYTSPLSGQQVSPVVRSQLQPQLLDLGRLGPKWFFGEVGVLRDEPRSASVYAETNVTLMTISKEDFFARQAHTSSDERLPRHCRPTILNHSCLFCVHLAQAYPPSVSATSTTTSPPSMPPSRR